MSIETTCKNCGEEHDMRHDGCPACSVTVNIRSSDMPSKTEAVTGHMPFEMFGERFAVTAVPRPINDFQQWRVSHVETGVGVPSTMAATMEEARTVGFSVLQKAGEGRLRDAIAKVLAIISRATKS